MKYIAKLMHERTSLDGMALIGICGAIILLGGVVKLVAWGGLLYGAYTLLKTES
jgi:hypothetical protein